MPRHTDLDCMRVQPSGQHRANENRMDLDGKKLMVSVRPLLFEAFEFFECILEYHEPSLYGKLKQCRLLKKRHDFGRKYA
jgi:hypothetical protein